MPVVPTDPFTAAFGPGRGRQPRDRLEAREPSAAARALLDAQLLAVADGELDEALSLRHMYGEEPPLLAELADAVCERLAAEVELGGPDGGLGLGSSAVSELLSRLGLSHCHRLFSHEGVVHLREGGLSPVEDLVDAPAACGQVMNPYDIDAVPRGG